MTGPSAEWFMTQAREAAQKERKTMTDQEMRVAIAEACGKRIDIYDLNAMHEAEKIASRELYAAQLLAVIHKVDADYFTKVSWENAYELTTATAHQRAEAFLKTLNLWEDIGRTHL